MTIRITIPQGTGTSVGSGVTTYSGLIASIEKWLNRSDLGLVIPDFITLLEDRLNRVLRTPEMEEVTTLTVSSATAELPTDFLEVRHIYIDGSPVTSVVPASLEEFQAEYGSVTSDKPAVYAIINGTAYFSPSPDTEYTAELTYWKKIPALSAANETNWLIASHPSIYLFGALTFAELFIWDDPRVPMWKSAWDEALEELKRHGTWKRHGGGPLAPRIANPGDSRCA